MFSKTLAAAGAMLIAAGCAPYPHYDNPPGPRGGPGTNWANPPGPRGGPGASAEIRYYDGRPYRWSGRRGCWAFDRDDNPPGPRGGRGTNWENPPGPRGGPGASPDRRGDRNICR